MGSTNKGKYGTGLRPTGPGRACTASFLPDGVKGRSNFGSAKVLHRGWKRTIKDYYSKLQRREHTCRRNGDEITKYYKLCRESQRACDTFQAAVTIEYRGIRFCESHSRLLSRPLGFSPHILYSSVRRHSLSPVSDTARRLLAATSILSSGSNAEGFHWALGTRGLAFLGTSYVLKLHRSHAGENAGGCNWK